MSRIVCILSDDDCMLCEGSGFLRCAETYRPLGSDTDVVLWEYSRIVRCSCG